MASKIIHLTLIIYHIITQRFIFIINEKNCKNIASDNLSIDLIALTCYCIHSWDEIENNYSSHPIIHAFDENKTLLFGPKRNSPLKVALK